MTITVNGEVKDVPDEAPICEVLESLGYDVERVAVAVNEAFIPRTEHASHQVVQDDVLDIVGPVQGG